MRIARIDFVVRTPKDFPLGHWLCLAVQRSGPEPLNADTDSIHPRKVYVNMSNEKLLTDDDKRILSEYSRMMNRRRNQALTPERRQEIARKASAAGLLARQANAARRKAEKEAACPQKP